MKFIKSSTEINLPFNLFADHFDVEKHFALQGIKKGFLGFPIAKISHNDFNQIVVKERKGMRFSYTQSSSNKIVVECYFVENIFTIILQIISLVFLVGFLFIPVKLIGQSVLVRNNIKKIQKNYLFVFDELVKENSRIVNEDNKYINSLQSKNNKEKDNIDLINRITSNPLDSVKRKIFATPPPFEINNVNSKAKNSTPPPFPKYEYYIVVNGEQKGPLDISTIQDLLNNNMLSDTTLIWTDGMSDWERISEIDFNS